MKLVYAKSGDPVKVGNIVWINTRRCKIDSFYIPEQFEEEEKCVNVSRTGRLTPVERQVYAKTIGACFVKDTEQ